MRPGEPGRAGPPLPTVDALRCGLGHTFDALGLGPAPTPSRVILRGGWFELNDYGGDPDAPALLIVPAPIKADYIWDMSPQRSAVRRGLEAGRRVYSLRWLPGGPDRGLAEYVGALAAAAEEIGGELILAGHSLGGTLAAIYASLARERPQGLLLVGAPLVFEPGVGAVETLLSALPARGAAAEGALAGSALGLGAFLAAPDAFGTERWLDWWGSWSDPGAAAMHLRVTRWTLDELPMPRRLFEDVTEHLYRRNRFAAGTLAVGERIASLADLTLPVLVLAEAVSRIVPPASAYPPRLAKSGARVLWYEAERGVGLQHVGPLVGDRAHRQLWPQVQAWLREQR